MGPRSARSGDSLADLEEQELLARMLPAFRETRGVMLGPGDDAAVVQAPDARVVVTTDAMVRDRDWRDHWSSAADVGHKAVTQNLADVAAMGAVPTGLLLTLVADPATPARWAAELAAGLAEAAGRADTPVLGGDLSSAPEGVLVVSVTALGDLQGRDPVTRAGARPGDVVAVAGTLGHAAAGLLLLAGGDAERAPDIVAVQRRPSPPLERGPEAARTGVHAMIDLSDGLVRDAGRIAAASKVGIVLDRAALAPDVEALADAVGEARARDCVLGGGEDHSLLACFAATSALPPGWRPVGRVVDGSGVTVDGATPRTVGWDHFGA